MDVSEILDDLNKPQREAVAAPLGHARILAGAGSGKTRVLVHRIAWLIQAEALSPSNIMAVTFTNKAASEMRLRIEDMLGYPIGGMWVGTFHGLAHRILRSHWQDADLPQGFQILDSDDQLRMIKRIVRGMELDEAQWPPKQAQWYINGQKDEGLRPQHIQAGQDPFSKTMLSIYQAYEQACQRAGVIDFGEMLLRTHEMWLKRPDILASYQQRFQQVLVDEFQDTNAIQYAWLRLLAGERNHLFIVGDDDQSIYGWRGARIENIQQFHQDYPDALTIRLEQNYRSTGHILAAANAVIANNSERLGKQLWTQDDDGQPVQVYNAFNERDEAAYVVAQIRDHVKKGGRHDDNAILYRSNAQSRVIEEALMQDAVPYRVYGGLRFFERVEIKDVLAYLRLVSNRHDDAAFERVVNTPTRGIGAATLTKLRQYAREMNLPMWHAAAEMLADKQFPARAGNALQHFLELVDSLTPEDDSLPLHELTALVIDESGLRAHFDKDKSEKGQGRIDNLDELINATRQFTLPETDSEMPLLDAFLANAALEAGDNQGGDWEDCVQLMTLHAAKGLEFPQVFMVGMEEGLFPGQRSSDDPVRLAEERRLCYVGMTRARQTLYLLFTENRFLYGQEMHPRPSRFLAEIPAERTEEIRARQHQTQAGSGLSALSSKVSDDAGSEYATGQQVHHHKFGSGIIIDTEGSGSHARVHVNFKQAGSKWLVLAYAKLETI